MPENNSNGGGFASWSDGFFDALSAIGGGLTQFGGTYVTAQSAQQIAASNAAAAAAGSQAVKPVYGPSGQVQFVPVQQAPQNNNRTLYIIGGVVVFIAVGVALYFGFRTSKG